MKGIYKQANEDFEVTESLPFNFDGQGEHQWVFIEKSGITTHELIKSIARYCEIPQRDVGHSGLKDRNALTRQWLSIRRGSASDLVEDDFEALGVRCLESHRHLRKLRVGTHDKNHFRLRLRNLDGDLVGFQEQLALASKQGVPNFFGDQRFGRGGSNLERIERATKGQLRFKGAQQRSMLLSSARSFLFNKILDKRVELGTWNQLMPGEAPMFRDGGATWVRADRVDDELLARSDNLMPTAAMPGKGDVPVLEDVLALESDTLKPWDHWIEWLQKLGVNHDRRATVMQIQDLEYSIFEQEAELSFSLVKGGFATTLLSSLGDFSEPSRRDSF